MFPRFREQIGTALDLIVEFSTLGEYRLASPGAPGAPADAPDQAPRLGGAGDIAGRAAVRRDVAGGAAGTVPAATPAARRLLSAREQSRECQGARPRATKGESRPRRRPAESAPVVAEQLCLAV